MKTLKDYLLDWTDVDLAQYWLACSLGLLEPDETLQVYRDSKGLFWSNNKHGNSLYAILQQLVQQGVLEYDEDELKMRWNTNFYLESKAS